MINDGIKFWENINLKELGIVSPGFYFFCFLLMQGEVQKVEWIIPLTIFLTSLAPEHRLLKINMASIVIEIRMNDLKLSFLCKIWL